MLTYQSYVQGLEDKKRLTPNGAEYWMARDLQSMLGYASWENFESAIGRARMACESAGGSTTHHFHATTNMITAGKGAQRERADLALSRYACYMIAMNADSGKQEVGYAQTYFAIQARRQEVQDQLAGTDRRLELRDRVKSANKNLTSAAKAAGVQKYGVFHDAGYKGMYGGIGKNGVQLLKGIPPNEDLLDCIGRAELAAHEFRATQAEQKLVRDRVHGERNAIDTHQQVGREVRETIKRLGGTMPEALPREPSIKRLVAQKRKQLKRAEPGAAATLPGLSEPEEKN